MPATWRATSRHSPDAGDVANYIPALAAADPCAFGIAIPTLDGRVEAVGEADIAFTIRSISKEDVLPLDPLDNRLSCPSG